MENKMPGKMCGCPHHKMIPVFIVAFGLLFLFHELNVISSHALNIAWPIVVVLAGLQKMFKGVCKCCTQCR